MGTDAKEEGLRSKKMKTKSEDDSFFRGEITQELISKDLERIGVSHGDHLALGLSFESIAYVKGGPQAFIDTLIKVVGSGGTIMVPTFTRFFHLSEIESGKVNYVFDYKSTPGYTGIVPETLRKREDSIRSRHPTNSVAAIGKLAKYLTEGHDETSGAYMPYSRLAKMGGKILCIELEKNRIVGLRHEVQHLAGLLKVIPFRVGTKYRGEDGNVRVFVRRDLGGCVRKLPGLVIPLRKAGLVTDGPIGMANSILVPAKEALEIMTGKLRRNPTLNLCDDFSCLWCRELERRMDLYKRIENPKYLQKYVPIIKLISLINRFRLRNHKIDKAIQTIVRASRDYSRLLRTIACGPR